MLQCQLDQQLGFGPRNEHRRIDGELQAVELLAAEDVRDRLAGFSPGGEIGEASRGLLGKLLLLKSNEARFGKSRRRGEEKPRLARIDAARAQCLMNGQAASSVSEASCSAWCSWVSASISSSSSPSMMRSIL